jgi:hypothetical protein
LQCCNLTAANDFLLLSAKSMSVLNPICKRFAAELNEISASQVMLRRPGDKQRSPGLPVWSLRFGGETGLRLSCGIR